MYFGLGKIGAILVPINHRLAGPEIEYILSDCEAKVLVFGKEFAEVVDSIRNDIPAKDLIAIFDDPPEWAKSYESVIGEASGEEPEEEGGDDDTLTILYTSGTTGRPKGAHAHAHVLFLELGEPHVHPGHGRGRNHPDRFTALPHRGPGGSAVARPRGWEGGPAQEPGPEALSRADPGREGERVRFRAPAPGFPEARARLREIRLELDKGHPRLRGTRSRGVDRGVCSRRGSRFASCTA